MIRASTVTRLATGTATLAAMLVALPVLSIMSLSLQPVPDLWPHLVNYVLPQSFHDTAVLLIGVGLLALSIGTTSAWLISSHDFFGRGVLLRLMPLPLAIPTYIAAYVYVDLFEPLGLLHQLLSTQMSAGDATRLLPNLRSLPGAIFVIGLVLYPYVYLSARAMFQARSADIAEAARVLGASRWTIFRRIALPMARPALAVGVVLVSLETLNDIGASEYLGVRTLTVSIFTTWLNRGSIAGAAQLSLFLLAIVAVLITIERISRRHLNVEASAENPKLVGRTQLVGLRSAAAFAACATPPLLGFFLPAIYLLQACITRGLLSDIDPSLWRDALNTITYAGIATVIAVVLGLVVVLAGRWRPGALATTSITIAQTGYALPGLVLALGLLSPVLAFDTGVSTLVNSVAMGTPGLLLMGSGAALVLAYVVRFLAIPTGFTRSGFARIPHDYDDSALSAGAPLHTTLRRIHLPLLRPALVGGIIVVFVDCLKELPATLLLRPLNVETLATSIYQHASRGSFEDGALAALIIVAVSVVPVLWLTRFADQPESVEIPDGPT